MYVYLQELAEEEGDTEKVSSLAQQLSLLEEKAEQLDKQRSKGLSAIRLGYSLHGHGQSVHRTEHYHA